MRLSKFIEALQQAEVEPYVEDLLDALWLAGHLKGQVLHEAAPTSAEPVPQPQPSAATPPHRPERPRATPEASAQLPQLPPVVADGTPAKLPVFGEGQAERSAGTRKASAVAIPAAHALSNRLALARALRPFAQRWQSDRNMEIDEERTVETTATLGGYFLPVLRPGPERWFAVDVIAEDDAAVLVWRETLREFCQLLRNTGAFRDVRSWQLRMRRNDQAPDKFAAVLESPEGARISPHFVSGSGTRRLILFATHGASPYWANGAYRQVIETWLATSSVTILQLLPQYRWRQTALGDQQGLCHTQRAGVATSWLDAEPFWWTLLQDDRAPFVPITTLDPPAMQAWAHMQMARGRSSPIVFLDSARPAVQATAPERPNLAEVERHVAALKSDSPDAFRLAVYLSVSPFTLPVARLVQATKFGSDPPQSMLAEILLSGLVAARSVGSGLRDPDRTYYEFYPEAREILVRSLRQADSAFIARGLQDSVSRFIERIGGQPLSFAALVPDENGRFEVPEWIQPFARLGRALLGLPSTAPEARALTEQLHRTVDPSIVSAIVELAAAARRDHPLDVSPISPDVWQALVANRLVYAGDGGAWRFVAGIAEALATPSRSRHAPSVPQRHVLDDYAIVVRSDAGPNLPPLVRADRDALLFAEWLSRDGRLAEDHIHLIKQADAHSVARMVAAVLSAPVRAYDGRRAYFYFVGHTAVGSDGLLLALADDYLPLRSYLEQLFHSGRFAEIVSVIDGVGVPLTSLPPLLPVPPQALAQSSHMPRMLIVSRNGSSAPLDDDASLTAILVHGLRGAARDADMVVTAASLSAYLDKRLGSNIHVECSGDIILARPPARKVTVRIVVPHARSEPIRILEGDRVIGEGVSSAGIYETALPPGLYQAERVTTGETKLLDVATNADLVTHTFAQPVPPKGPRTIVPRHIWLAGRKVLFARYAVEIALDVSHFDRSDSDINSKVRALRHTLLAATDFLVNTGNEFPLDSANESLLQTAQPFAASFFEAASPTDPEFIASFKNQISLVQCARCVGNSGRICDGGINDDFNVDNNGLCFAPFRSIFEYASQVAYEYYARYGFSFKSLKPKRPLFASKSIREPYPIIDGFTYREGAIPTVVMAVKEDRFDLQAYDSLFYIFLHECICHVYRGIKRANSTFGMSAGGNAFVDGWLDWVTVRIVDELRTTSMPNQLRQRFETFRNQTHHLHYQRMHAESASIEPTLLLRRRYGAETASRVFRQVQTVRRSGSWKLFLRFSLSLNLEGYLEDADKIVASLDRLSRGDQDGSLATAAIMTYDSHHDLRALLRQFETEI